MGDVDAVFREHHAPLWRFLTRLIGDSDLAADAAQTAFVRFFERPPKAGNERAWLFQVGRNAALEAARTRTRRLRLLHEAPARIPQADPTPKPDEVFDARERSKRVREALARLGEWERTVLLMREEGFSHREIADSVRTTTGSVGTMIARSLDKLAAELHLDQESTP